MRASPLNPTCVAFPNLPEELALVVEIHESALTVRRVLRASLLQFRVEAVFFFIVVKHA